MPLTSLRSLLFVALAIGGLQLTAACTGSGRGSGGGSSGADALASLRVLDLGHALSDTDPTWDGEPVFSRWAVANIADDTYAGGAFATEEHFGTHVDAPAHFVGDGLTVDKLPPGKLVRPAVCLNIEAKARGDDDYRLTVADIEAFERQHGTIPADSLVLVATGWDARWPDPARYMNTKDGQKHFPGVSVEAATLLARDRHIAGIGIDTPSIDYGPSTAFEAHRVTMAQGLYHVENAAGLVALPPSGFTVVVAPIKIAGGSGGPARVFALLR